MKAVHPAERSVRVTTYGRLHLGFFNLSQQGLRRFGSMGVSIDAFQTSLTVTAGQPSASLDPWVQALMQRHLDANGRVNAYPKTDVMLTVHQSIPRHGGLGSGTQMALALGAAINTYHDCSVPAAEVAAIHQRGARSGIGIATFEHGGLVLDGGRGAGTVIPPMLARHAFPEDWHFLLILDHAQAGLHGQGEKQAFKELAPQTLEATQQIQQQLLSEGLPALLERDFSQFSQFLGALQAYNAEYFGPAQGGPYASPSVATILQALKLQGYTGLGQTSWGPTGFVLCPSRAEAVALQLQLLEQYADQTALSFVVTAAMNQSATIEVINVAD